MPKGQSGRIVVELEPALKRQLYSALAIDNKTLKQWVEEQVEAYLGVRSSIEENEKAGSQ